MFVIVSLGGVDCCVFDAGQLPQRGFDLSQIDPVAEDLNSKIRAPHVLQEPFRIDAAQVARTKLPHAVVVTGKPLGRERRLPPIPCGTGV